MLYFLVKYKRKPGDRPHRTLVDLSKLEIFWTVVPLILIFPLFHLGFKRLREERRGRRRQRSRSAFAPSKWLWDFEYPNGMRENNKVLFPINRPIKMVMSSEDVIHSFYIPEFRLKKDVVPGMYSTLSFTPTVLGDAHVFCAEYCGTSHSGMLAEVKIVTPGGVRRLHQERAAEARGHQRSAVGREALHRERLLHLPRRRDGVTKSQCPNLKGVWGAKQTMHQQPGRRRGRELRQGVDSSSPRRRSSPATPTS